MDFILFESFFFIMPLFSFFFVFIIWFSIIKSVINAIKRNSVRTYFKSNVIVNSVVDEFDDAFKKYRGQYKDVKKSELTKFNVDNIEVLKDHFYNLFFEFEKAYNNLDYDTMNRLSTKQVYHNYHTGISLNLKSGRKRIIDNIERKNVIIYELDSTIAKQTAGVMIEVSYINYMVDKKGNVISGSRRDIITEKFDITFRKDYEKEDVSKCPNCGANIVGNKCEYCRTVLKDIDFKISTIKKIIDK